MKHALIAFTVAAVLAGPVIAQDNAYAPQPGDNANPPAPGRPGGDKPVADKPVADKPSAPVTPAPDKDANGVYQVFRNTDNQLNCDQLIAEMNNLNAVIKSQTEAQAKAAQPKGNAGRSIAGGALGGALGGLARGTIARNIGGLGYTGAVAAAGATDAASAAVGSAVANGSQTKGGAAPATASNEQQRLNRVSGLFQAKGC